MKKHVAATLLVITVLGVTAAHLSVEQHDNGWLLVVDGRRHDAIGTVREAMLRLTRQCAPVRDARGEPALAAAALAAVRNYSPPDSASARLLQLQAAPGWLLAEVEFERLFPAVVLLREAAPSGPAQAGTAPSVTSWPAWQIEERAIWSGLTHPWKAAPLIRDYLHARVPDLPAPLLDCFEPRASGLR
ncbi:MAG: hypothetical protein EBU07_03390 [Betaproteobacteria bacterium]|nr:hypothetical protein [Betaproteobacteria bacterium]NBS48177.1 hypothetical protein [Betaproteobacteria bacterium]